MNKLISTLSVIFLLLLAPIYSQIISLGVQPSIVNLYLSNANPKTYVDFQFFNPNGEADAIYSFLPDSEFSRVYKCESPYFCLSEITVPMGSEKDVNAVHEKILFQWTGEDYEANATLKVFARPVGSESNGTVSVKPSVSVAIRIHSYHVVTTTTTTTTTTTATTTTASTSPVQTSTTHSSGSSSGSHSTTTFFRSTTAQAISNQVAPVINDKKPIVQDLSKNQTPTQETTTTLPSKQMASSPFVPILVLVMIIGGAGLIMVKYKDQIGEMFLLSIILLLTIASVKADDISVSVSVSEYIARVVEANPILLGIPLIVALGMMRYAYMLWEDEDHGITEIVVGVAGIIMIIIMIGLLFRFVI